MLGQQEPGIWSSRATDVHSPLSRSPRCAGLKWSPFFPTSLCAQESPLHSCQSGGTREQASWTTRLHGFRVQWTTKVFLCRQKSRSGVLAGGLGLPLPRPSQWALQRNVETARIGGGPSTYPSVVAPRSLDRQLLQASSGQLDLTSQKSSHELALEALCEEEEHLCDQFGLPTASLKGSVSGETSHKALGRETTTRRAPSPWSLVPTVSSSGPTAATSPPTSRLSIQANGSTFTKGPGHTPGSPCCSIPGPNYPWRPSVPLPEGCLHFGPEEASPGSSVGKPGCC